MLRYSLRVGRKLLFLVLCGVLALVVALGSGLVRWRADSLFLLGPVALALLILAWMLLIERRLALPMRQIGDALERLAQGDTDIQLPRIGISGEIGHLSQGVLHLRDAIRSRGQAEDEAHVLLAQKNMMLDQAPAAILLEREGVIVACNAYLERVFGYLPGELAGFESKVLYADDSAFRRIGEEMSRASQRGEPYSGEAQMRRKDGSCFWGLVQASISTADTVASNIWVYADICDRKRLEHDLRQRLLRLEELVSARTRQLEEVRRVGAHVGKADGVPGIPGFAAEPFVESIPFDLAGVVEGVIALMAPRAAEKNLELVLQIDPEIPSQILGPPLCIAQVLANLLNVVIGGVRQGDVNLIVREVGRDRRMVRLHFNMHGHGLEKALDPKRTPHNAQSDGLGLAISKRLVESMGGVLEPRSEHGDSTCFHFTVEFKLTTESGEKVRRYAEQLQTLAGRRVMVIDDNRSVRQMTGALLSRLGLVPMLFESGRAALTSLVEANAPAYLLICVDLGMPDVDGLEVARRLHAHYGAACPAVLLLATPGHSPVLSGLPPVVAGVISKPITIDRLFGHLAAILRVAVPDPGGKAAAYLKGKRILLVMADQIQRQTLADFLHSAGLNVRVAANGIEGTQAVREEAMDCIMLDCRISVFDACEMASRLRTHAYADLPIIGWSADISAADRASCLAAGMNQLVGNLADLPAVLAKWMAPSAAGSTQGDLLPPLPPELDIEGGLRRLRGKPGLFLKALRMFRDSCGRQFQLEFCSAVSAGDWRSSALLARSLKDSAAAIGATQVSAAAARLEAAIHMNNYAEAKALLAEATEKLRVLVEQLSHIG